MNPAIIKAVMAMLGIKQEQVLEQYQQFTILANTVSSRVFEIHATLERIEMRQKDILRGMGIMSDCDVVGEIAMLPHDYKENQIESPENDKTNGTENPTN